MSWRGKADKGKGEARYQAPPGYRGSGQPLFTAPEVVSSAYQVRARLHSDPEGELFEARDMLLERTVAIRAAWRDADGPGLLAEARAIGRVSHGCAGAVYGLGNHRGIEYLVAERIDGTSLADATAEHIARADPLPAAAAIDELAAIASGIAAALEAGIVMDDLRSDTIVRTQAGRLVFGKLAFGQSESQRWPAGPFAPEILQNGPGTTRRDHEAAALYALGIIAVELLLGRPPFIGDTGKATAFNHVHQRPTPISAARDDVPIELSDLAGELLAKEPFGRPSSVADVEAQLRVIADRARATRRPLRVLIVDDAPERVRPLWSIVRRACASVDIDACHQPRDIAASMARAAPDLIIVELARESVMNALELCMFVKGCRGSADAAILALGAAVTASNAEVLERLGIQLVDRASGSVRQRVAAAVAARARRA